MTKFCCLNLGCKVNQYEIDGIINQLIHSGYEVSDKLEMADFYIINTCAVTNEAEKKSRQMISKIKAINKNAKIIVCGCASQNNPEQFDFKEGVFRVIGTFGKGEIINNLSKAGVEIKEILPEYEDNLFALNVRTRGYVKIQDGCNKFCSYCLIPYVRGRSRSRNFDSIMSEAEQLSQFCNEIVITGIDVSDFKIDGKNALDKVIYAFKDLPARIRLSSLEVNIITEDFLKTISKCKNFCPHFHLSLQSGSNEVLKKMNRHYTTEFFYKKVLLIRKYFPNVAITTDIIVGFPGETDECFIDSINFIKKVNFSHVHFFAYSSRKGTVASHYPQINGNIIKNRENMLKRVIKDLEKDYCSKFLGQKLEVLVEELVDGLWTGYSREYVRCYIKGDFKGGDIVNVFGQELFEDGLLCKV